MTDERMEILTNTLGNRMLDMVAPIYDRSKVALYYFQALGIVLQRETDFVWNDFVKQIFPQTATWGLDYWEDEYGIMTDKSKTIEQRRAYFMSMMFEHPPMTPKRIEDFIRGMTGFECDVIENTEPNTFQIIIRGYVDNITPVLEGLNKKTPAHLVYNLRMGDTMHAVFDSYPTLASASVTEKMKEIEVIN